VFLVIGRVAAPSFTRNMRRIRRVVQWVTDAGGRIKHDVDRDAGS
jgi:hypothetical protein